MLERSNILSLSARDQLRLDFAVWLAKRARQHRCGAEQIVDVIISPIGAEVAADRARKPGTEQSEVEPVRQVGGEGEGQHGPQALPDGPSGKSGEVPNDASPAPARAFVPPSNEHSETTAKRAEVAELHAREPWLKPNEAAARVLIPIGNLRIFTRELEIAWSQPRPPIEEVHGRRKGLQNEVRALHEEHPKWSAVRIAEELDCTRAYVAATAQRLGLTLPAGKTSIERPTTLRDRVSAIHAMHPSWGAGLISKELGCAYGSASTYLADARRAETQAVGADA